MHALIRALSRLTATHPAAFVGAAVILTVIFGGYAGQLRSETGNDAFSPDNPELAALERVGELFTVTGDEGSTTIRTQVVVTGPDVVSAEGVAVSRAIREAAREGAMGFLAVDTPQDPAIIDWLGPANQAAASEQVDLAAADSATVDRLFAQGLDSMPSEFADRLAALLGASGDAAAASSPQGLAIISLDVGAIEAAAASGELVGEGGEALGGHQLMQLAFVERGISNAIAAADYPDGYEVGFVGMEALFSDDSFEDELPRLFGVAAVVIMLILGSVYFVKPSPRFRRIAAVRRTIADVAITMFAIVASITWMNGIIAAVGGTLSPVTQIVPILLIGLGVDYAIHLTARYREELGKGHDVVTSGRNSIGGVGVALALATVTTVFGFLTNILNPLPALRDFGWQAAVGMFSAFVLMITFVPAMRMLLDRRAEKHDHLPTGELGRTEGRALPSLMARTALLAEHAPGRTLAVAGVLAVIGIGGMTQLESGFSFVDFVPDDNPSVAAYNDLTEHFAGGFGEVTNVLVEGDDVATVEVHNAAVASLANVAQVADVVVFGGQTAADSPVARLQQLMLPAQASPDTPRAAAPDPDDLSALAEFRDLAEANGLQPDGTFAADGDVAAVYAAASGLDPSFGAVAHRAADGTWTAVLIAVTTQAGESGASALQDAVHAAFEPLAATGVELIATSQNIMAEVILGELSASQISSLILTLVVATVLMAAVFWVRLRRPMLGVITVAPVVLVLLLTFAAMAATGITFNPMTSMISALAIGIGVPFTIHVTHRFEEDLHGHADLDTAMRSTMRNTGGALAGSAFTTMAGFATLVTSSLQPFRQLGLVVAYAIGFALVASVLVLPSMLALWHRWHLARGSSLGGPVPAGSTVAGGHGTDSAVASADLSAVSRAEAATDAAHPN